MRYLLCLLFSILFCGIARADFVKCSFVEAGSRVVINYDEESVVGQEATFREVLLDRTSYLWPPYWFEEYASCESPLVIEYLARKQGGKSTDGYCLIEDESGGWALQKGEKNFRGRCKKSACEHVNDARVAVVSSVSTISGFLFGGNAVATAAGVSAVEHSSGALILTGTGGYISGTLGTVGTSIVAFVTAPASLLAVGGTAIAGGTAVYVCYE